VKWWLAAVFAVIGGVLIVFSFTEPAGAAWSPRWRRWATRAVWFGLGVGMLTCAARFTRADSR
jgi:hypothetical protein